MFVEAFILTSKKGVNKKFAHTHNTTVTQRSASVCFYTTFYLTCIFRACEKIFPDLDENLPLGVVFCVDHESDIIFFIRDRDQG